MKNTKKLLALLLVLLLDFGLALPAMAAVNWDEFYIITEPQGKTVPYGLDITLSVEVNIPAGVKVTYQWFSNRGGAGFPVSTRPVMQLSPSDFGYPRSSQPYYEASDSYYCKITAVEEDAGGNPVGPERYFWSSSAYVTVTAEREMNLWEKTKKTISDIFANMFLWSYIGVMWFLGILLVPYNWILNLFA